MMEQDELNQLQADLERLLLHVRAQKLPQVVEDMILDLLDCLTGWCNPRVWIKA